MNVNDPLYANAFVHIVTCCSSVANVNYVLNNSWHADELITADVIEFVVHILYNGKIVKSGPKELALELEERGYDFIKEEVGL